MKKIKLTSILSFTTGTAFAVFSAMISAPYARAATFELSVSDGASSARGMDQVATLFGSTGVFTTISNVMLFAVGAISVIMVVVGGLRYVVSGGNSTSVSAAKNTILYAVVGLIISLLAYAMINFVISSLVPGASTGGTDV